MSKAVANIARKVITRYFKNIMAVIALFCSLELVAQNEVPDANFRNCLTETYPSLFTGDNQLVLSEAEVVLGIYCPTSNIQSAEGLEYFENATSINLANNQLNALPDLSGLINLSELVLDGNQITSLPNLSANVNLSTLTLSNNNLTAIPDLSAMTNLQVLSIGENPLAAAPNLSANTALVWLAMNDISTSVFPDLSQNTDLLQLHFYDNPQFGVFPDLSPNANIEVLNCSGNALTTIPSLAHLPNLVMLNCASNNLTALPGLSVNPALVFLYCSENNLTSLPPLNALSQLRELDCSYNEITQLPDLLSNAALEDLYCNNNQLDTLPVLSSTNIGASSASSLVVSNNKLRFNHLIQIADMSAFEILEYAPQANISMGIPNAIVTGGTDFTIGAPLTQHVSSNSYLWSQNATAVTGFHERVLPVNDFQMNDAGLYSVAITNDELPMLTLYSDSVLLTYDGPMTAVIPDAIFRGCLQESYPFAFNGSNELILSETGSITSVVCTQRGIESIEGINYFDNATHIMFNENQITVVPDISGLTKLTSFDIGYNNLGSNIPDFSGNWQLQHLSMETANLTAFPDLSNNEELLSVYVAGNQIATVPDLSANKKLISLSVGNNPLTSLPDFSQNTALTLLHFENVDLPTFPNISPLLGLTSLNFSNNPQLGIFPDLSNYTGLQNIMANENGYQSIPDLSTLTDLRYLGIFGNQLTSLPSFSSNSLLEVLDCQNNEITSLPDLSSHVNLRALMCSNNQLTVLPDLSQTAIASSPSASLLISNNGFTFEDVLPVVSYTNIFLLSYAGQALVPVDSIPVLNRGIDYTINLGFDSLITTSVYEWYKDGSLLTSTSSNSLLLQDVSVEDDGTYQVRVRNPEAPELELMTESFVIETGAAEVFAIPDPQFKACLQEEYPQIFDAEGNLLVAQAEDITIIQCFNRGIQSIEGIGYFRSASIVDFERNLITELPDSLANLHDVWSLNFSYNALSSGYDFSPHAGLRSLNLAHNNLTEFPKISQNTNIETILVEFNQISEVVDLSSFANLTTLLLDNNPITAVPDLSQNLELQALGIQSTQVAVLPDLSANSDLIYLDFALNPQLNVFPDLSANAKLEVINCAGNGIGSIPDLGAFPQLSLFNCSNNQISSITLSNNPRLTMLLSSNNLLTDVPNLSNTAIGVNEESLLWVANNRLTFEDIIPLKSMTFSSLDYSPQLRVTDDETTSSAIGLSFTLSLNFDEALQTSTYEWYKDAELIGETTVNEFVIEELKETDAGVYYGMIRNSEVADLILRTGNSTLIIDPALPPWEIVSGGGARHAIEIPASLVTDFEGKQIVVGDYIGVYFDDDNGDKAFSAYVRWNGTTEIIQAQGRSLDPSKDGFDVGEKLKFAIWKKDGSGEVLADAIYDIAGNDGFFSDGASSTVTTLQTPALCQSITLHHGWNLVSGYVKPTDIAMQSIFDNNELLLTKTASGQIPYAPDFGISSGNWDFSTGYMVYSGLDQTFDLCGRRVSRSAEIALTKETYPALLPYYGDVEAPISAALASVAPSIDYVQSIEYRDGSETPESYLYIPSVAEPVDDIGMMKPGLGYKVSLINSVESFQYPEEIISAGRSKSTKANRQPGHFVRTKSSSLTTSALLIPADVAQQLQYGDEIAVLDGAGQVVGSKVFEGSSMGITLWETEHLISDPIYTLKTWSLNSHCEKSVSVSYEKGSNVFQANTLSIVSSLELVAAEWEAAEVFPNPAREHVLFKFDVAAPGEVQIQLIDALGNAHTIYNGVKEQGRYTENIDLSLMSTGHYAYKILSGTKLETGKLVIVR